jgi:UDP-N-acetylglucosamine 2-epimerase (non-hydrolysing)
MPRPDINLEVGSGTHAEQTAQVMLRFERVLGFQPGLGVVPGDVNSTLACALVAVKLGIRIAHIEAGLRSFDRTMPEEINRLLTDQIADLLFTTAPEAGENLAREGIAAEKIHFVGNTMIDTLVRLIPIAERRWPALRSELNLDRYVLVTLHRPANVDEAGDLAEIISALNEVSSEVPAVFPVHPHARASVSRHSDRSGLTLTDPDRLCGFSRLVAHATVWWSPTRVAFRKRRRSRRAVSDGQAQYRTAGNARTRN